MLVSYVITTYNQEETILQTLDSIVNQKMNSDDYEIIVCDDFSKDDTAKVVDKWLKKNKKVNAKLLVPEANQGTVKNLLMGVATCQGQYIMSLAGDDWLVEDSAANMNSYLVKNNPAVVCTNLILYYEAKKEFVCNQLQKNYLDFYKANAKKQNNLLTFHNYVYAPSVYIKTEVFKKIIPAITDYKYMEDYPMWYAITKLGYHIDFCDIYGVYYRQGENNITNTGSLKPHQKQYYQDIIDFKEYALADNHSFYKWFMKHYIKQQILDYMHTIGAITKKEYSSKSKVNKLFNIARYVNFILRIKL